MAPAKRGDFFSWDLDLRTHLQASTGANMRAFERTSAAMGLTATPMP
jgi:hypothetical protein